MGKKITVVDYGMGNIGSLVNMFKYIGIQCTVTNDRNEILSASKLILPGVGNFDKAMENITRLELDTTIKEVALMNVPILGICLGMQLLCNRSEEGTMKGLGLIDANVKRIKPLGPSTKVPHMGWNSIKLIKPSPLFEDEDKHRFYFVHSYYVDCNNPADILATTDYCSEFVSCFSRDNLVGVQFHPEKSHKFGISFFDNFVNNF